MQPSGMGIDVASPPGSSSVSAGVSSVGIGSPGPNGSPTMGAEELLELELLDELSTDELLDELSTEELLDELSTEELLEELSTEELLDELSAEELLELELLSLELELLDELLELELLELLEELGFFLSSAQPVSKSAAAKTAENNDLYFIVYSLKTGT